MASQPAGLQALAPQRLESLALGSGEGRRVRGVLVAAVELEKEAEEGVEGEERRARQQQLEEARVRQSAHLEMRGS